MPFDFQLDIESAVAFLTFCAVFAAGGAVLVLRSFRRQRVKARLGGQTLDADIDGGDGTTGQDALVRVTRAFAPAKTSSSLKAELAMAGFFDDSASAIYLGSKVLLLLLALFGSALLALVLQLSLPVSMLMIMAACGTFFFLPNYVVQRRRSQRTAEVRSHLPDAVDLLEICVTSGMGLDMAWNAVTDEIRGVSETLADEMALANLEMNLGASRTDALRHMVARTGAEELGSLVGVLIQSERFGTSMSDALRVFAETMRQTRSMRAEEEAEKMAVKLLFPMVLLIFPVIIITVAGPAAITLLDIMGD